MADSPRFPLADDRAVAQDGLRDAPEAPVGAGHPAAAGARDDARPALSRGQAQAYLARIGFAGTPRADRATLDAIVARHQMSVPFETIGLHRGDAAPPDLGLDALFRKVVAEHRGGYCFELNRLLQALLATLGFSARPALCRAVLGRERRMPINHRGILIALGDEELFADVGFGGPMPLGALPLRRGEEQVIAGETFATLDAGGGWWRIERVTSAAGDLFNEAAPPRRQVELELCEAVVEEQDFDALNLAFSSPGTLFRDHELANLRTPRGYVGLRDGRLTVREDGRKTVVDLPDGAAVDAALRERFGLRY